MFLWLKDRIPFYYGWVIVAVSFVALIVVFGIRLSFSVFFVALIEEFGWQRADTSLIFSVSMLTFAGTSTFAGLALDNYGARVTFAVGVIVLAFGLFLSSRINVYWQLVAAYGVVAGLGITILGLGPQAALISRWFRKKRGVAIGIAFAGTGIGTLTLTPGVEWMISMWGWRAAYVGLAGLALAGLPFVVGLLRLAPEKIGLRPDGDPSPAGSTIPKVEAESLPKGIPFQEEKPERDWRFSEVIRNPAFWLLIIASIGAIGPVRMLTVHQLAAMTDAGFNRSFSASIVGASGVITAIMFILSGALSDRIGRRVTYAAGAASLILAVLLLNALSSPSQVTGLGVYILLLGIGEGSRSSLLTAVAADLFPGGAMGAVNGAVGAAFGLGAAFVPWFAGYMFDLQGAYSTAFYTGIAFILVSTIALWFAPVVRDKK